MPNVGIASIRAQAKDGRSVVVQQFGKAPLQVHAPLYLENTDYPTVYLRSPSAGLLDGDTHQLDIIVEAGAKLEVRSQAATLVYPGRSSQTIRITLASGATLVFTPHPFILASHAAFRQDVEINLADDSKLVFCDHWCAGRIAMGERFQFESFANKIRILRNDELVFAEAWQIHARQENLSQFAIASDFNQFRSLYEFGSIASQVPDLLGESRQWSLARQPDRVTRTAAY
jgi:urease accessory protein